MLKTALNTTAIWTDEFEDGLSIGFDVACALKTRVGSSETIVLLEVGGMQSRDGKPIVLTLSARYLNKGTPPLEEGLALGAIRPQIREAMNVVATIQGYSHTNYVRLQAVERMVTLFPTLPRCGGEE